jgi:hypothetical protein
MYYLVHTLHFDSVKFVEACVKQEKRRLRYIPIKVLEQKIKNSRTKHYME